VRILSDRSPVVCVRDRISDLECSIFRRSISYTLLSCIQEAGIGTCADIGWYASRHLYEHQIYESEQFIDSLEYELGHNYTWIYLLRRIFRALALFWI
jgi:hypothetical protein